MALIKGTNKIMKADIPDSPAWFDKVLSVLNSFLDTVIGALRGRLTFRENFYCQVKEFTFTHDEELEILYEGLNEFNGVLLVRTPEESSDDYIITGWKTRRVKPNVFGMKVLFQGAGTTSGKVKFIILG